MGFRAWARGHLIQRRSFLGIIFRWNGPVWGGRWKFWFVGKSNSSISTVIVFLLNPCFSSDFLKNTRALFVCWLCLWFVEMSLFLTTSCFPWDGLLGSLGPEGQLCCLLWGRKTLCSSGKPESNFQLLLSVCNFENELYFPLTVIAVKTPSWALNWQVAFLKSRRRQNDL